MFTDWSTAESPGILSLVVVLEITIRLWDSSDFLTAVILPPILRSLFSKLPILRIATPAV